MSEISAQEIGRSFSLDVSCFGGFFHSSAGKESTCNAGDPDLIPGQEDPLEKG